MLERISTPIVFMLFDASLKAILLWTLAMLAIRTFRRMSVHEEHRVWTVALLGLVVLPILAHAGPSWSLPLGVPSVSSDQIKSRQSSADSGAGGLNEQITVFPGQTSSARGEDSLRAPISGAGAHHALSGSLPSAGASIPVDGPVSSPVDSGRFRWLLRRSSLLVLGSMAWLCGVLIMLARLLIAVLRTLRIERAARLVTDQSFPPGLVVRESEQIKSPVVAGWWRPSILLPCAWREWTDAKRAAVISHEQTHLRRRDTSLSLLAELVTLFYWFHPVSWWTRRELSRLAELACDEAAAIATGDRLLYAQYLLEIASANRKNARLQPGLAMARSSDVGPRVRALLDLSRPLTASVSRPARAAILLVGIPALVLLGAFRPTRAHTNEQRTASPAVAELKQTPAAESTAKLSGEPTHIAPAAADQKTILTMTGTVFLPDGSVATDAVLERSPDDEPDDVVSVKMIEGEFEIRSAGTRLMPASILFRTPDWSAQAFLEMESRTLRSECAAPKRITLAQAKLIRVKVTDGKRAVADCHVQVSSGHKYMGVTRSDGVAPFKIANDASGFFIVAWSDDHRIGGSSITPGSTLNQNGGDFQVEISHGDPVRVRVVDAKQQPVANVPLLLKVFARGPGALYVGDNPTSRQTTNASGEAVFSWVPNCPKESLSVRLADDSPWRESHDREPAQAPDGVRQLEVAPLPRSLTNKRVAVNGQLSGLTAEVSELLIEFLCDQGDDEDDWDAFYTRCDASGRFTGRIMPGRRYKVFVEDRDLVSNLWDGIIADKKDATVRRRS